MRNSNVYKVHSPWGAIAAFFLLQCFGFVALQGFRMFVNIAARGSDPLNTIFQAQGSEDRILMPLWGAVWIFIFVVFQTVVLHRITRFLRAEGIRALFAALAMPAEAVKLAFALLFGFGYLRLLFGHYPFPSQPISISVAVAFGVFGWGVSALIVWSCKKCEANGDDTSTAAGWDGHNDLRGHLRIPCRRDLSCGRPLLPRSVLLSWNARPVLHHDVRLPTLVSFQWQEGNVGRAPGGDGGGRGHDGLRSPATAADRSRLGRPPLLTTALHAGDICMSHHSPPRRDARGTAPEQRLPTTGVGCTRDPITLRDRPGFAQGDRAGIFAPRRIFVKLSVAIAHPI